MRVSAGGLTASIGLRGARIHSLRDEGREWLLQTALESEREAYGREAFVDAAMAGWDECAPSVDACPTDDRSIPDHGDLWNSPFERDGDVLRHRGGDYTFERRVRAAGAAIRLEYRVRASRTMPFLWAAHPLFVAPTGTRVILPDGVATVRDVTSAEPHELPWSAALGEIAGVPTGAFRKLYADPAAPVRSARITHPDGASLVMRWSPNLGYLGLWFDRARFAPSPVIAIEPATGFYDSLQRAIENGRIMILRPGVEEKWWLEVSRA